MRNRKGRLVSSSHPYQQHHRYRGVYLTCPQLESVYFKKGRKLPAHEHHTMDEYTHEVLCVIKLGTRSKWVVSLKFRPLYSREMGFRCPLVGNFFGSQVLVCLQVLTKWETLFCRESNTVVQSAEIYFTELRRSVDALVIYQHSYKLPWLFKAEWDTKEIMLYSNVLFRHFCGTQV
jgi:hypothetical protein